MADTNQVTTTSTSSSSAKGCCCCCYCSKNKTTSIPDTSDGSTKVNLSDCKLNRTSLRREMAHLRTNDIALVELVEELQQRVRQLQDRVKELQVYVTYSTYDRAHLVDPSVIRNKDPQDINTRFTPFELYRRYLVGDYRMQTDTRGYQTDEDILNRVNPKPDGIYTPINYLPSPEEDDRPRERIYVKEMFIDVGLESGAGEADLSEIYEMRDHGTAEEKALAHDILKKYYSQGVMDTNDMSSDTEV